eukprot:TRINITY_DN13963_c0_g1_i2.p1 TRINITY_DN13963_c0_g1~~TRINITY_DN13963_c0_g1_i2.p1  ORF type:complete len:285 (-),score=68.86 TRINITY_DN13963_c0_g1_i2:38-787(-)
MVPKYLDEVLEAFKKASCCWGVKDDNDIQITRKAFKSLLFWRIEWRNRSPTELSLKNLLDLILNSKEQMKKLEQLCLIVDCGKEFYPKLIEPLNHLILKCENLSLFETSPDVLLSIPYRQNSIKELTLNVSHKPWGKPKHFNSPALKVWFDNISVLTIKPIKCTKPSFLKKFFTSLKCFSFLKLKSLEVHLYCPSPLGDFIDDFTTRQLNSTFFEFIIKTLKKDFKEIHKRIILSIYIWEIEWFSCHSR